MPAQQQFRPFAYPARSSEKPDPSEIDLRTWQEERDQSLEDHLQTFGPDLGWTNATLLNSWGYATGYGPYPGFRKVGLFTAIRGVVIKAGGAIDTSVIMNVPAKYRPSDTLRFVFTASSSTANGQTAEAVLGTNGNLYLNLVGPGSGFYYVNLQAVYLGEL